MQKTFVLSLGGSLIWPEQVDVGFLRGFKKTIEGYVRKGFKFAIICGGGKLARAFQQIALESSKPSNEELDWLGIHATKINAHIVKSMFHDYAEDSVASDPTQKITFKKEILVASGWKPGWSTDYDAVLIAKKLHIVQVVNMSNVDYVYDKDPRKFRDAKKLEEIKWKDFRRLIGDEWKAGMNAPFDPVAAKEADKAGIEVSIIGKSMDNLKDLLDGKKFNGTIIRNSE